MHAMGVPLEEISKSDGRTVAVLEQALSEHGRLYPEYQAQLRRISTAVDTRVQKVRDEAKEVAERSFGTLKRMSFGDDPAVTDGGRYKASEKILQIAGVDDPDSIRKRMEGMTYEEAIQYFSKYFLDIYHRPVYGEHQGNIIRLTVSCPKCGYSRMDQTASELPAPAPLQTAPVPQAPSAPVAVQGGKG